MQIQKYAFRKTIGGLSIMASVLLLLIGFTQYDQLFSSAKYDFARSAEYAKTALQVNTAKPKSMGKFKMDGDGEIIITKENSDGAITAHYRALYSEELVNNYEDFPELYVEVVKNNKKQWIKKDIYKIDREKGLVYFLLKLEKNHQTAFTDIYTGNYKIKLIK